MKARQDYEQVESSEPYSHEEEYNEVIDGYISENDLEECRCSLCRKLKIAGIE